MSMIDVLIRVDAICKKYDKYEADKHRHGAAGDPFSRLYAAVDADIDAAIEVGAHLLVSVSVFGSRILKCELKLQKSESAATETNRAAAVALNADVRRTKARLMEEVVKLRKLAAKTVKGLSPEEAELRGDLVLALPHWIQSIPDGGGGAADQNGGGNVRPGIKFDSSGLNFSIFTCRDGALEFISEGLDTLKNLAEDMNEVCVLANANDVSAYGPKIRAEIVHVTLQELNRQVPLMDEIDNKVDKTNADLRRTNVRLKETVNQHTQSMNLTGSYHHPLSRNSMSQDSSIHIMLMINF
uniref:t-SNARE coiled-coil homology domain-containing protein n=1 Tax=Oryza punctata TaxID=4537 RepID=A0A0E0M0B0_ORYPU